MDSKKEVQHVYLVGAKSLGGMEDMRKYLQAKLHLKRDIASYILLVIQAVLLLLIPSGCIMYMIQIVLFIMLIGFYRKEVLMPLRVLKSKVKSCR